MLKIGKIPENILKRSVIKRNAIKRQEVLVGAKSGEEGSAIETDSGKIVVTGVDTVIHTGDDAEYWGVNHVANAIASYGGNTIGISVSVILPEGSDEQYLKQIIANITDTCKELNIELLSSNVELSTAVTHPVITLSGIGSADKSTFVKSSGARTGDDVVVTKWIGLEGTAIAAKGKQEELKQRFSGLFVDTAIDFSKYASVITDAEIALQSRVSAMHNVGSTGIFGALWEIADASGVGLSANLMSIPIRQETVEICEEYDINPYELLSGGSLIIVALNGYDIVRNLQAAGINAAVVGKITDGNDRVIINGDEKRFLVPPRTNETVKIM